MSRFQELILHEDPIMLSKLRNNNNENVKKIRAWRGGLSEVEKLVELSTLRSSEAKTVSEDALEQAHTSHQKADDLQLQLDNIVPELGESNGEVSQARGPFNLLYQRFDNVDERTEENTTGITKTQMTLEEKVSHLSQKSNGFHAPTSVLGSFSRQITSDSRSLAFPSVEKFNGRIYVVYRRADTHTSHDGEILLRTSDNDGNNWSNFTVVLREPGKDFRDPQLIVFNGRLVLRAFYREGSSQRQLIFTSSADGQTWEPYHMVTPPPGHNYAGSSGSMLIKDGMLISTAYTYPHPCSVFIVTTDDMISFNVTLTLDANHYGYGASESTIEYLDERYRLFCRTSPEDSQPWFTCRLDDNFQIEHIRESIGNLDGPRSLAIDNKKTFLTFRDNTQGGGTQRVLIAIADRLGRLENKIIIQSEGIGDSGYLDLKKHDGKIYGVYYEERENGDYRISFARYDAQDLSRSYQFPPSKKRIYNATTNNFDTIKEIVGQISYVQNQVAKEIDVVVDLYEPIEQIRSYQFYLRCADNNHYIYTLKNVTLSDSSLVLTLKIRNIEGVTSSSSVNVYYNILHT